MEQAAPRSKLRDVMKLTSRSKPDDSATSPEYRARSAIFRQTQTDVAALMKEVAAFRDASNTYAAAAKRFHGNIVRLLEERDTANVVGEAFHSAVLASHQTLLDLLEVSVGAQLGHLAADLDSVASCIHSAEAARAVMYASLKQREELAAAADQLGTSSKLQHAVRASAAASEHRAASERCAAAQSNAIAAMETVEEVVQAALVRGLHDATLVQSDEVSKVASSLKHAAHLARGVVVPKVQPTHEQQAGAASASSEAAAAMVFPATSAIPLLVGEVLLVRVDGVREDGSGGLGVLIGTNYRIRWIPALVADPHTQAALQQELATGIADSGAASSSSSGSDTPWRSRVDSIFDMAVDVLTDAGSGGSSSYTRATQLSIPLLSIARAQVVSRGSSSAYTAGGGGGAASGGAGSTGAGVGSLVLSCTDQRLVSFSFDSANGTADTVMLALSEYVWAREPTFAFAYKFLPAASEGAAADGWTLYSPGTEYVRLGGSPHYRLTGINKGWKLCSTYPEELLVPAAVSDSTLSTGVRFRSKQRMAAVVWYAGRVSLSRCAQPLTGMFNARSAEDEMILAALVAEPTSGPTTGNTSSSSSSSNSNSANSSTGTAEVPVSASILCILDARPRLNALGNAAKGGGTELMANYPFATLEYLGIDNIHVVRDALRDLRATLIKAGRRSLARQLEQHQERERDRTRRSASMADNPNHRFGSFADVAFAVMSSPGGGGSGGGRMTASASFAEGMFSLPSNASPSPTLTPPPTATVTTAFTANSTDSVPGSLNGGGTMAAVSSTDLSSSLPSEGAGAGVGAGSLGSRGLLSPLPPDDAEEQQHAEAGGGGSGGGGVAAPALASASDADGQQAAEGSGASGGAPLPHSPTAAATATSAASPAAAATPKTGTVVDMVPSPSAPAASLAHSRAQSANATAQAAAAGSRRSALFSWLSLSRLRLRRRSGLTRGTAGTPAGHGTSGAAVSVGVVSPIRFNGVNSAASLSPSDGSMLLPRRQVSSASDADRGAMLPRTMTMYGGSNDEGGVGKGGGGGAGAGGGGGGIPMWLRLVSIQLAGGVKAAQRLTAGVSVMVHCSDGWDRTAALTSLAQLLIDPYYRTLEGFCVLIQKEWVSFGHRFGRRCGTGGVDHDRADANDGQRAPIFLQWLDCTWQILRQYPCEFEVSERLLIALAEHAYSGRFGTFLFDCEKDRAARRLWDNSVSMWTVVLHPSMRSRFINPCYAPSPPGAGVASRMLEPVVGPDAMAVWPYWIHKYGC